ncbi:F0F1 ATP synthase subunit A [Patescibacteria group bacterium]|nr:F0F1 ATP synthase subunit A [Patescibacteria group bacterium]MBU4017437.1 F0F1 ATP synthase subunit A [Patescibacteria group bacterium]MBU4099367.1 F0F1 ATP synthase subunit A [Patescibacteria group bacterium]
MSAGFAPETIINIGSFPITNTILNTLFVDAVIIGGVFYLNKRIKKIPGFFQNITEMLIQTFYDITETISGSNAKKIFPFFMSFFIFILIANWSGLIPGNGAIGLKGKEGGHLIPIFRNATSDLNVTLALALISVFATHVLSLKAIGLKDYLSRFFSFNPINLFVGILEIISEITKIISLSFRLFGNIFAGEIVLITIGSLFAFIFPLPFIALEIIVGLVQALVFSMLTMVFMTILMTPHHQEAHA